MPNRISRIVYIFQQIHIVEGGKGLSGVDVWLGRLKNEFSPAEFHFVNPNYGRMGAVPSLGLSLSFVNPVNGSKLSKQESTLVVHYNVGAYLYALSQTEKDHYENLRIVSFLHSDEDWYYDAPVLFEKYIHQFVAVSKTIRDNLIQRIPHREADIACLPYGLIPQSDRTSYTEAGPLRITYAGRFVNKQKRIEDFVDFAEKLHARNVDFRLHLFGDGSDRDALVAKADQSEVFAAGKLIIGKRLSPEQTFAEWNLADICLQLSDYEGTSISMLEAMAAGAVPVVKEVSGVKEVISPGADGFFAGNHEQLIDAIVSLDNDRNLLKKIGSAAKSKIENSLTADRYLEQYQTILTDAWKKSPVRFDREELDGTTRYLINRIVHIENSLTYRFGSLLAYPYSKIVQFRNS